MTNANISSSTICTKHCICLPTVYDRKNKIKENNQHIDHSNLSVEVQTFTNTTVIVVVVVVQLSVFDQPDRTKKYAITIYLLLLSSVCYNYMAFVKVILYMDTALLGGGGDH